MKLSVKHGVVYSIPEQNKPIPQASVSSTTFENDGHLITHHALGADVQEIPERYSHPAIYIVASGELNIDYKEDDQNKTATVYPGGAFIRPAFVLCTFQAKTDCVYTEICFPLTAELSWKIKQKEIFFIRKFISYDETEVKYEVILKDELMELLIKAIPAGGTDREFTAYDDVSISCIEGEILLEYEGEEYTLQTGQSFVCEGGKKYRMSSVPGGRILVLLTVDE